MHVFLIKSQRFQNSSLFLFIVLIGKTHIHSAKHWNMLLQIKLEFFEQSTPVFGMLFFIFELLACFNLTKFYFLHFLNLIISNNVFVISEENIDDFGKGFFPWWIIVFLFQRFLSINSKYSMQCTGFSPKYCFLGLN